MNKKKTNRSNIVDISLIDPSEYDILLYKMIIEKPIITVINRVKNIAVLQAKVDGKYTSLIVSPLIRNVLKRYPEEEYIQCRIIKQIDNSGVETSTYIPLNPGIHDSIFSNDSYENSIPIAMIKEIYKPEDFDLSVKFKLHLKNITQSEYDRFVNSLERLILDLNENGDIEFPDDQTDDFNIDSRIEVSNIEVY